MSQVGSREVSEDPIFLLYQSTSLSIQKEIDEVEKEIELSISTQRGYDFEIDNINNTILNLDKEEESQKKSHLYFLSQFVDLSGQMADLNNTSGIQQKIKEIDEQIQKKQNDINFINQEIIDEDNIINNIENEISTLQFYFTPIESTQKSVEEFHFVTSQVLESTTKQYVFLSTSQFQSLSTVRSMENSQNSTMKALPMLQQNINSLTSTFNFQDAEFSKVDLDLKVKQAQQDAAIESNNLVNLKNDMDIANKNVLDAQESQNKVVENFQIYPVKYKAAMQSASVVLNDMRVKASTAQSIYDAAFIKYSSSILDSQKETERIADELVVYQNKMVEEERVLKEAARADILKYSDIYSTSLNAIQDFSGQLLDSQTRVKQYEPIYISSIQSIQKYKDLRDTEIQASNKLDEEQDRVIREVSTQDTIIQQEKTKFKKQVELIEKIDEEIIKTTNNINEAETQISEQQTAGESFDLSGIVQEGITILQQKLIDQTNSDLEYYLFKERVSNAGITYATSELQLNDILQMRIDKTTDLIPQIKELDTQGNLKKMQEDLRGYEITRGISANSSMQVQDISGIIQNLSTNLSTALSLESYISTTQSEIKMTERYRTKLKLRTDKLSEIYAQYKNITPFVKDRIDLQKQVYEVEQNLSIMNIVFTPIKFTDTGLDDIINTSVTSLGDLGIEDTTASFNISGYNVTQNTGLREPSGDSQNNSTNPIVSKVVSNTSTEEPVTEESVTEESVTEESVTEESVTEESNAAAVGGATTVILSRGDMLQKERNDLQNQIEKIKITENAYMNQLNKLYDSLDLIEKSLDKDGLDYLFTPSDLAVVSSEIDDTNTYSENTSFITTNIYNAETFKKVEENITEMVQTKKKMVSQTIAP